VRGPIGMLVADFDQHLTKVGELNAATRYYRRRYAREFLDWRFEGKRWDLTNLGFADCVCLPIFDPSLLAVCPHSQSQLPIFRAVLLPEPHVKQDI
jgi:hypothetical protein